MNKYKKEKNEVFLTSVFVKYGDEQFADGQKILADYNCTFPMVSVSGNDSILKYLNIQGFPEIIILDENKEVIFKGSLERAKKKLATYWSILRTIPRIGKRLGTSNTPLFTVFP